MTPDPTLRADLMAFLAAGAPIILSTPDYAPMCSRRTLLPKLFADQPMLCGADCQPGQHHCLDHRREYEEKRQKYQKNSARFHDDTLQILRAYRFLRRRANRRDAA